MEAIKAVLSLVPAGAPTRSAHDALALAVHAILEFDGLRCVAVNEDAAQAAGSAPASSQPLDQEWRGEELYSFWYKHASSPALLVVKCLVMEDTMIVHAASDKADDVFCLDLRVADFVNFDCEQGLNPEKTFADVEALQRAIRVNLTCKLLPELSKTLFAQRSGCAAEAGTSRNDREQPWQAGDPTHPGLAAEQRAAAAAGLAHAFGEVGRADLAPGGLVFPGGGQGWHHPLGPGAIGGGAGSMFGPGHPMFGGGLGGGLGPLGGGMGGGPNWAAPPGARIDPMGPPGVMPFPGGGPPGGGGGLFGRGRREFPDTDHFRPPRGDDMFM